jgi:IPT/TIG domain
LGESTRIVALQEGWARSHRYEREAVRRTLSVHRPRLLRRVQLQRPLVRLLADRDGVLVVGTDFTGATDVSFGGVSAGFTVNSSTSITATAPPNPAGTVDVTVTTAAGSSAASSSDHFPSSAASAPTVTSLATISGTTAGSTLVGVNSTNFTNATVIVTGRPRMLLARRGAVGKARNPSCR